MRRWLVVSIVAIVLVAAGTGFWWWRQTAPKPLPPGAWTSAPPVASGVPSISGGRPELVLQTGHLDRVGSVAFSPDSRLLASSSDDGTVKLWDVQSRRELRSLAAPESSPPPNVGFSRDGQWLTATGLRFRSWSVLTGRSTDAEVRTNWKAGTANGEWRAGETERGLLLSQDQARGAAVYESARSRPGTNITPHFSPDDRWLAVEESDGFGTEPPEGVLGDLSKVQAAALNDSADETIQVWEVSTWRAVMTIPGRRPVNAPPVFSADGRWLAVIVDGRRAIELWDVAQAQSVKTLASPTRISTVAFSPDSRLLLAVDGSHMDFLRGLERRAGRAPKEPPNLDDSVVVWDLAAGTEPRTIAAGRGVESFAFSPDSQTLAVTGAKGMAYWDLRELSRPPVRLDEGDCASVAFSADGRLIAWTEGRDIKIRELASSAPATVMSGFVVPVGPVALSRDGGWVATADAGDPAHAGLVRLWDTAAGREAHTLDTDATGVSAMVFSEDGRRILTFGDRVMTSDTATGRSVGTPGDAGPSPPLHVASDDGRSTAWGPDDQSHVFLAGPDLSKPARRLSAKGPVNYLAFSADGRWIAASGCIFTESGTITDCAMRLWDAQSLTEIRKWDENAVNLAISPDGRHLAAAGGAGRPALQVWDVASGAQELSIGTHLYGNIGVVNAIKFSSDGRLIAFADDQHAIQIWDVTAKKQLTALVGHTSYVGHIVFDRDGRILSTSHDGTIRLWDAAAGELLVTMVFLRDPKQWLAVTPSGLFDGSPEAWGRILWRFRENTFDVAPVDTFFNEFYYPGLLADVFAGRRPAPPRDIAALDRRQPKVRLSVRESNGDAAIDTRMVRLRMDIEEVAAGGTQPAGARDLRLFRNGSLVKAWRGDLLTAGRRQVTFDADVPITAGANHFTAYVFNKDNVKSEDAALTLTGADALARKGTAYVIAIGVNEYANPTFNLKYAVADAERFAEQFAAEQQRIERFERVQIVPLLDKDATKGNVLRVFHRLAGVRDLLPPTGSVPAAVDQLPPADPEDVVFIFFAGHGITDGERFYLVPHDLGYGAPRDAIDQNGVRTMAAQSISDQELERALESVNAGQLLLVIDACHSGQALEASEKRQGPMNSKGLAQLAYEKGMSVLTASQSYQAAMETERLGHGLLTYALVEAGLASGGADYAPKDGSILLREWLDFAAERVPTLQLDLLQQPRNAKLAAVIGPANRAPENRGVQRPRVFYRRELEAQPLVIARR